MSDWVVIEKTHHLASDAIMNLVSVGAFGALGGEHFRYTIENKETGDIKSVVCENSYELGEIIAEGDLDD